MKIELLSITENAEQLIELGGRTAYQSQNKITENSAEKFISTLIKMGHTSVLEHASASFLISGISRSCCYDKETEILTKDGWKLFKDINKIKDEFFTLNINTLNTEYQKATQIFSDKYCGEMLGGKSTMVDFLVTPNHRMFYFHYDSRINKKWKIDECNNIFDKRIKFKRGIFKDIIGEEFIEEYPQQKSLDFARFMGIWITDGSLSKQMNNGGRITITQKKIVGKKYIEDVLNRLGWKYTYRESNWSYTICNTKLYIFLRKYFPIEEKKTYSGKVPKWIRLSNKEYINAFLEGVIIGDGSIDSKNHVKVYTASKEMAGNYQELFMKNGLCATIWEDNRVGQERILNNNIIRNNVICYVVSVTKRTNDHLFNHTRNQWYKIKYNDMIYCITVPNSIIYVRRNGKSFWCGNSHQLVRHRLSSFTQRSQRYVSEKEFKYVEPESIKNNETAHIIFKSIMDYSNTGYKALKNLGIKNEDARFVLPEACETELVMTANFREWRHIIKLRIDKAAQWEIREVCQEILKILKEKVPVCFGDL